MCNLRFATRHFRMYLLTHPNVAEVEARYARIDKFLGNIHQIMVGALEAKRNRQGEALLGGFEPICGEMRDVGSSERATLVDAKYLHTVR